jgi:S-adenosylmethionine decarboxylase
MMPSHILVDVRPADADLLKTVEPVWSILREAVARSGATVIHTHVHQFSPHGFSGFFLIAESHVSVHSWVELGLLAIDILSCGNMDPQAIVGHLREHISPAEVSVLHVTRGELPA